MNIGIDIDDTMTNTSELIIEYAKEYFNSDDVELINSILNSKSIEGPLLDFYNKYLLKMIENYTLKDNVKEVIDRLRSKGHKIFIITARAYTPMEGVVEATEEYFKKHGISFDGIIFKAINKRESCVNNKIDVMVDDSVSVAYELRDTNVKPVLFNSVINENVQIDVDRIDNWIELEKHIDRLYGNYKKVLST